jgi:hypothetical protein
VERIADAAASSGNGTATLRRRPLPPTVLPVRLVARGSSGPPPEVGARPG